MRRGTKVEQFGAQLSAARKAKGYTQEQLAEKLAVSRTNISRWESGKMMPDLDTVKRLSQILDYNFFAEQDNSTDTPPQETPVSETPSPAQDDTLCAASPKQSGVRKPLFIAAGALVLIAAIIVCLLLNGKPSGGKAQANVTITPLENPTYAINAGEDMFQGGVGWFYEFQYEETAGVPFTINEYIVTTIADSGYEYNDYYTSDDVTKWLGSPTLRAGEPQSLRGGFPLGPAQGVRITLNGTDANGNELSFSGYVELSKEIKE